MKRNAGVLCPIFSMFGSNGIGDFSSNAEYFIRYISEIGFKYLQILPLSKIGLGNSPYMSESGFSGNEIFISLDFLVKEGLITGDLASQYHYKGNLYKVDYEYAKNTANAVFPIAYQNINQKWIDKTEEFANKNSYWLEDFALYKALIDYYKVDTFLEFPKEIKYRDKDALKAMREQLADKIFYYKFLEALFYTNWMEIKTFANEHNVKIIGDLPFYLSSTACEVWANKELFVVDKNYIPKKVAGVPPDYFNEKGQKWGNVLYNYDVMRKDNFKYLRKKFAYQLELYDILRIDHFRAFDSYYTIDNNAPDGTKGVWKKGIGREFLPSLIKKYGKDRFIAEDLGCATGKVQELVDSLGIPPMRVFQFGFDGNDSEHLPHNYCNNMVVYSGTHDNNTSLGWLYSLDDNTRTKVLDYLGYNGKYWGVGGRENTSIKCIIRHLLASSAGLVIFPIQDLLGFGADTRFNVPGVANGNWEYRLTPENIGDIDDEFLKKELARYFR